MPEGGYKRDLRGYGRNPPDPKWPGSTRVESGASGDGGYPAEQAIERRTYSLQRHVRAFSHDEDADQDNSVAAVIAFYPPVEFQLGTPVDGAISASRLLEEKADAREAELASPIHHAGPHLPPTCLFHGTDDHIVLPAASMRLFDRLRAAGTAVDLHLLSGQTHAFAMLPSVVPQVQGTVAAFLDKHLIDPQFYIEENLKLNQFAVRG
jgi:acetyl esterase/lipase